MWWSYKEGDDSSADIIFSLKWPYKFTLYFYKREIAFCPAKQMMIGIEKIWIEYEQISKDYTYTICNTELYCLHWPAER